MLLFHPPTISDSWFIISLTHVPAKKMQSRSNIKAFILQSIKFLGGEIVLLFHPLTIVKV